MNGLESGAFGLGQDVVDQLPTTQFYVECGWWTFPFCDLNRF